MTARDFKKAAEKAVAKVPGARDVRFHANDFGEGVSYMRAGHRFCHEFSTHPAETVNRIRREQVLEAIRADARQARQSVAA